MFLDRISNNLFKPLASKNARLYGIGLHALYKRLIESQESGDECTPKEAKDFIRRELFNQSQTIEWQEEDELIADTDTDLAGRIYNRLRDTDWLIEMDEIGYRRITSFPPDAAQLLNALSSLGEQGELDLGSICLGVYSSLKNVLESPRENAHLISFAAKSAKTFYAEASALSFTTRELAYRMLNQSKSSEQLDTFFNIFINQVFTRDYKTLHSKDNPYRFRGRILSQSAEIAYDSVVLNEVVNGILSTRNEASAESIQDEVRAELQGITKVFTNIPTLMEGMERYRRSMTRRTREAIRYSYRSTPDIGRRLDAVIGKIASCSAEQFPAPLVGDTFLAAHRLYERPGKKDKAEATALSRPPPPLEQIARDRAFKAYLQRRMDNPVRLKNYLEKNLGDNAKITSCDMQIDNLDDLLAYLEVRKLMAGSQSKGGNYAALAQQFNVQINPGHITENKYVIAPQLVIQRVEGC